MILQEPAQFNVPTYFLNRRKDRRTGKDLQLVSNDFNSKEREDFERMEESASTVVCATSGVSRRAASTPRRRAAASASWNHLPARQAISVL